MAVRQRGNSWQVDVRLPSGKRERKSFTGKNEALTYEASLLQRKHETTEITMSELVDITWRHVWRDNVTGTESRKLSYGILEDMGWLDKTVMSMEVHDLVCLRDYYRDVVGNTGATVNRKLSHVNKMLSTAQELDMVAKVPHLKQTKELGGRERVLSTEEEQKMLRGFLQHEYYRAYHLFVFLLDTGCRVGEALRVTDTDVSHGTDASVMLGHYKDKNGRIAIRKVPMTTRASESVMKWGDLQQRAFNSQWRRVAWAIGITGKDGDEFVPHMLRHTCATRLATQGMDLRDIKEWLGHKTIEITMRYAKFQPSRLTRLRDVLEGVH